MSWVFIVEWKGNRERQKGDVGVELMKDTFRTARTL